MMDSRDGTWREYGRIKVGSVPDRAFFGIRIQSKTANRNEITVGMTDIQSAP